MNFENKTLKELETEYLRHKFLYYIASKPEISDYDFDTLENHIRSLKSSIVDIVDFPSIEFIKTAGYDINKICPEMILKRDETKYKHSSKMLSIKKLQIKDELNFPLDELNSFLSKKTLKYECSPKYDGNAMSINYSGGKLIQALSRGDGTFGLDRTTKIKLIVPNNIPLLTNIELRGEILMRSDVFFNKYHSKNDSGSERSIIGGFLSREQFNVDEIMDLVFVAYSLCEIKDGQKIYIENSMAVLEDIGFNKTHKPFIRYIKDSTEFEDMYFEFKKYRETCEFLLDGIVIKYPEDMRAKLGDNGKYPKSYLAIKFLTEDTVVTTIEDIVFSLGKDGRMCPVAILKPCMLGGCINVRASLYNLGFIINNGAFVGALVRIRKSGEIINQVTEVVEKSPNHDLYMKEYYERLE